MRVKPAATASGGEDSDAGSDKTTPSTSGTSTMGYTKGSAPSTAYPQPAYPNFFDLLDSPDAEETDSPLPAELEEEFLDMLAESDIGMYPPPPYQGPATGYANQGYGAYPNQYMNQYTPYTNYGYGQNVAQGAVSNVQSTQNAKVVVKSNADGQLRMDTGDANNSYQQGVLNDLQTVDQKPVIDPIRTIANKVGIAQDSGSGDNTSNHSESENYDQPASASSAARHSVSSESSPGAMTSPSSSGAQTTVDKRKISASARSRAKKDPIVIEVPEEVLYEEAKSKPIKHRKEPDIVESKDRSVRNAINARVNRQKHKLYVDGLEAEVEELKKANQDLEQKYQGSIDKMADMQNHIKYLENVIANDISISNILNKLGTVENVKLSSSISRKRKLTTDSDTAMDLSEPATKVSGGVCLHVDKNNVSIEFCEKCAEKAQATMNGTS